MIGRSFDSFVVIEESRKYPDGQYGWLCLCKCGAEGRLIELPNSQEITMNPGIVFTALVASVVFGYKANRARKMKKLGVANAYGWSGIIGYSVAMVGMF